MIVYDGHDNGHRNCDDDVHYRNYDDHDHDAAKADFNNDNDDHIVMIMTVMLLLNIT